MNRRGFLLTAACIPAVSLPASAAHNKVPMCRFPTEARARLAVASYPFRKDVNPAKGTMKLLDFPKMVVERFGVRGIEPLDEHFPSLEPAYLAEFRNALHQAGAHVVNIPVGRLQGSFYDPDQATRALAVSTACKWIDVAVAIGSPGVRVHIQPVKGVQHEATRAAVALRDVAKYGQQKGVIVTLENDDPVSEDAPFIVSVIQQAGTPWLRALPDFANSMILRKGDAYNYESVDAMFRLACNISHVKELETDEGQLFRVDLAKTFAIAERYHYRGYFSIEWDSDGDPYDGTKHLIEASLQALKHDA